MAEEDGLQNESAPPASGFSSGVDAVEETAPEAEQLPDCVTPVAELQQLQSGAIVRRRAPGKDQQGRFVRLQEDGQSFVVEDVIDLVQHEYLAEAGIIRPGPGEQLYQYDSVFGEDPLSREALDTLSGWSLYKEHPELRNEITQFVRRAFSPSQIKDWKRKESLRSLFVTIQHRFRIGRHREKTDWNKVRLERFGEALRSLHSGKHMTYVAFIPRDSSHEPMYFTIGTKPHLETSKQLEREPFAFRPNHGGHIKCVEEVEGVKVVLVDAGSNDLGAGMHTPLAIAEMVAEGLKRLYPDLDYRPVPGREAFGLQQSY